MRLASGGVVEAAVMVASVAASVVASSRSTALYDGGSSRGSKWTDETPVQQNASLWLRRKVGGDLLFGYKSDVRD